MVENKRKKERARELINALSRPRSLDVLLFAAKKPLKTFSAQRIASRFRILIGYAEAILAALEKVGLLTFITENKRGKFYTLGLGVKELVEFFENNDLTDLDWV